MKALSIEKNAVNYRADLPFETSPNEVVIQPLLVGVCRTDIELAAGYMNFSGIPGHEFVGRVVSGSEKFVPGTLVVGEINCGCQNCDSCKNESARHCQDRTVLGILNRPGAMAESLCLPDRNLLEIPSSMRLDTAVFTEPVAAACRIIEQKILPEDGADIAVVGDGKLGILIAFVLDHFKHNVTLYGHHPVERVGLFEGTNVRVVHSNELSSKWQFVVEVTGRPEGFAASYGSLKPQGTLILKTTTHEPPPIHLAQAVIHEITIIGSRCGPFDMALTLLSQGVIPVEKLIATRLPLSRGAEAFRAATQPGALKVLIEIQD